MSETMERSPVQSPTLRPNQFELSVPRNERGERIGTGAIVEPLRPGLPGETARGAILKALLRAGRDMQAPRGVAEQAEKRTGLSYITAQERAQFEARKQQKNQTPATAQRQPDEESTQLKQADKQQTESALDATRSELKSEAAAQTSPAKPQPQDRNEGAKQPEDKKEKKPQQETELIHFYDRRDGHELFALQLPRKYTSEDVNMALKAAGINGTYSTEWTSQPQDKREAVKQPAERKAQKEEPETEPVRFYNEKDGHLLFTLQLPKGGKYTTADVNRAAKAAGINYTYSPAWTLGGWRIRFRDIIQATKKAWQASEPPSAQLP